MDLWCGGRRRVGWNVECCRTSSSFETMGWVRRHGLRENYCAEILELLSSSWCSSIAVMLWGMPLLVQEEEEE